MQLPYFFLASLALFGQDGPKGAVPIQFDKAANVSTTSAPVKYLGSELSIVSLGDVRFERHDFQIGFSEPLGVVNKVPPGLYGVRWGQTPPRDTYEAPTLKISHGPFLKAKLKASIAQYNEVEYRVSCAVFDKDGRLLGTASHIEKVQYVRLGHMPTIFREIDFDFGASKSYANAAFAVFSISDPVVPPAPDAG